MNGAHNPTATHLLDLIAREGRVRGHQEMTSWRGNQGCNDSNEVVVHVSRVPKRLRRS